MIMAVVMSYFTILKFGFKNSKKLEASEWLGPRKDLNRISPECSSAIPPEI
jgi:hypothetical protein